MYRAVGGEESGELRARGWRLTQSFKISGGRFKKVV